MRITINENSGLILILPDDYKPVKLPMRDEWITALLSGEYQQGKNFLFSDNKYCCLGVLSRIQGRLTKTSGSDFFIDGCNGSYIGLSYDNPVYQVLNSCGKLSKKIKVYFNKLRYGSLDLLNDNGVTFADIAKIIKFVYES